MWYHKSGVNKALFEIQDRSRQFRNLSESCESSPICSRKTYKISNAHFLDNRVNSFHNHLTSNTTSFKITQLCLPFGRIRFRHEDLQQCCWWFHFRRLFARSQPSFGRVAYSFDDWGPYLGSSKLWRIRLRLRSFRGALRHRQCRHIASRLSKRFSSSLHLES